MPNDLNINQLIEQGEIAREQEQLDQALSLFDQAILTATEEKNYQKTLDALAHRLIIYKHAYEKNSDLVYMELFYSDVLAGLRLAEFCKIGGQARAVFYSRAGDYFLAKQDFTESLKYYQLALEELNKTPNVAVGTKAEYLGHYGQALARSGDKKGFAQLDEALAMIRSDNSLRPFHCLAIESGILLRKVDAYAAMKQPGEAKWNLIEAKKLADVLATEHKMKIRQSQARILEQQLHLMD